MSKHRKTTHIHINNKRILTEYSMNTNDLISLILSGATGAGITVGVLIKYGERLLFKHLDHKYSERLSERNTELQKELEQTKNKLEFSLQQSIVNHKADLDVLLGQRAKYLERKIDCILSINRMHVQASRAANSFCKWVLDGLVDAETQLSGMTEEEAREQVGMVDYSFRMRLVEERLPPVNELLISYFDEIVLNLPILPAGFTSHELDLHAVMRKGLDSSHYAYRRLAGIFGEIAAPEEGYTYNELKNEITKSKTKIMEQAYLLNQIESGIIKKAAEGRNLIELLLRENKN